MGAMPVVGSVNYGPRSGARGEPCSALSTRGLRGRGCHPCTSDLMFTRPSGSGARFSDLASFGLLSASRSCSSSCLPRFVMFNNFAVSGCLPMHAGVGVHPCTLLVFHANIKQACMHSQMPALMVGSRGPSLLPWICVVLSSLHAPHLSQACPVEFSTPVEA